MKLTRWMVAMAAFALMGGGYIASQLAYFRGETATHALVVDTGAVPWLATLLFVAIVALAFVPAEEESK